MGLSLYFSVFFSNVTTLSIKEDLFLYLYKFEFEVSGQK